MSELPGESDQADDPVTAVVDERPGIEPTGHPRIDEALQRLERLGDHEITAHPEEFDAIHGVLRESLANAGRDEVDLEHP